MQKEMDSQVFVDIVISHPLGKIST